MMKRSTFASLLALGATLSAASHDVMAQAAPAARPGVAPAAPPAAVAPSTAPPGTMSYSDVQQHPELMRPPNGLVDFTIEDGDLAELITAISTITGKRFIYGGKVRNIKVNIYAPKQQKITVAEAYQTFLSVLETNGLTVIPHGKFLKIVESAGIAAQSTPLYNTGQPVPAEDRYVTRLYRLGHISADEVAAILAKFKSKDADITVYAPGNLLILTDTASNIRRMLQLVEEVDVGGVGDQVWVEPIHYTTATEMSQRVNEIFDVKAAAAPPAAKPNSALNDVRISKVIPEDRSNSLIIVATERAYLRVLELIRRLDVPNTGEGEVHVLPLQHAMAEELATTLNAILTGAAAGTRPAPAAPGVTASGGIFEGAIKVTADKSTNSLVITSSLRDYGALRGVIDRLDMPRRQVFIEAVIMDLSIAHITKLGLKYHGADPVTILGGGQSVLYGGLNPIASLGGPAADAANLQGLAIGVRGPDITSNLLGTGISIPAFGVILSALATSGDVNVLATPHIIATDNVAAEINVGENIPLQTNVGGGAAALGGLAGGAAGALGALGGLGGLGLGGFAAPRQDVGTKIKVVPHINDSDEVRLELTEEISERGTAVGALGAVSITKRNAQTTIVVQDQQTVVIGGLMRDSVARSESKVPILGDIPVLGALFRSTDKTTTKTNLLLILTPYVIRDQNDLRTVFERKMQERQEFLDRYFVFSDQKQYEPPRDFSRTNGLVEEIRQSYFGLAERQRLEEETRPRSVRTHEAQQSIELPLARATLPLGAAAPRATGSPGAPGTAGAAAAPAGAAAGGAAGAAAVGATGGAVGTAPAAPGAAPVAPVIVPIPVGGAPAGSTGGAGAAPGSATPAPGTAPAGGSTPGTAPPATPPGAAPGPTPPGAAPGPTPPGATPPATPPGAAPGPTPPGAAPTTPVPAPAPFPPPIGNTPPAGGTLPTIPQSVTPTTGLLPRRLGTPAAGLIVPPLGSLAAQDVRRAPRDGARGL